MARAQNGWPVVTTDRCVPLVVRGVTFPQGVLRGVVHAVLADVAEQWHTTVEPLIKGHCWGYARKKIGKGEVWSNHAAGCAIDINAPEHPDNTPPSRTLSPAQIAACHAIEQRWGGVVRWGGDWSDPDPMHWEVVATLGRVVQQAARVQALDHSDRINEARMVKIMNRLPYLSRGAHGPYVTRVQLLGNYIDGDGPNVTVDGEFGPQTEALVKRIQRAHGLQADGSVGAEEWSLLVTGAP